MKSRLARATCIMCLAVCILGAARVNSAPVISPATVGTASLSGHVTFADYSGSNWLLPVGIEFSHTGYVLRTERVFLDAAGNFTITGIEAGTYDLAFSASGCLQKFMPAVSVQSGSAPVDVTLDNGDLNGDNSIGLSDLSILSTNYGQHGQ